MQDAGFDRSHITVVTPTYNRRERVRQCLEGLFREADRRLSLHVVDDGSSDGTPAVLQELKAVAPACVEMTVHQQQHEGAGAARNRAIRASETDLVIFLDDDCVPEPGWLAALLDWDWAEGVGARGGRIVSPEGGNRIERYCRHIRYNEFPPDDGPIRFLNTANCAYPRRVLLELNGLDPRLYGGGEAQDLSHRLVTAGYALEYAPSAVVVHYHRQSVRDLLRGSYRRGARSTLRRVLWGLQAVPSRKRVRKELAEFRRTLGEGRDVARMAKALRGQPGVAAEDALTFALLDWARAVWWGWGKVTMMDRIARGKESLAGMEERADHGSHHPLIRRHGQAGEAPSAATEVSASGEKQHAAP